MTRLSTPRVLFLGQALPCVLILEPLLWFWMFLNFDEAFVIKSSWVVKQDSFFKLIHYKTLVTKGQNQECKSSKVVCWQVKCMIYNVWIIKIRFILEIYFISQAMVMKSIQNANMAFIDVRMVRVNPPCLTVNTLSRMSLCDERIHKLPLTHKYENYPNILNIFSCMLKHFFFLSVKWLILKFF